MPNLKRILLPGYYYHLTTRGNQKQKVFKCVADYLMYLRLLRKFKRKYNIHIYAYCLMPNHVHLLVGTEQVQNISNFMHDLNRTYTLCFNKKYNLVGHLWQGRFKSKIIFKNSYLIDCITYIEYNPLRAKLVKNISEYRWSSYPARILGKNDGITDELPMI